MIRNYIVYLLGYIKSRQFYIVRVIIYTLLVLVSCDELNILNNNQFVDMIILEADFRV